MKSLGQRATSFLIPSLFTTAKGTSFLSPSSRVNIVQRVSRTEHVSWAPWIDLDFLWKLATNNRRSRFVSEKSISISRDFKRFHVVYDSSFFINRRLNYRIPAVCITCDLYYKKYNDDFIELNGILHYYRGSTASSVLLQNYSYKTLVRKVTKVARILIISSTMLCFILGIN